jgi:hypothetical protein
MYVFQYLCHSSKHTNSDGSYFPKVISVLAITLVWMPSQDSISRKFLVLEHGLKQARKVNVPTLMFDSLVKNRFTKNAV